MKERYLFTKSTPLVFLLALKKALPVERANQTACFVLFRGGKLLYVATTPRCQTTKSLGFPGAHQKMIMALRI